MAVLTLFSLDIYINIIQTLPSSRRHTTEFEQDTHVPFITGGTTGIRKYSLDLFPRVFDSTCTTISSEDAQTARQSVTPTARY